MNDQNPEDFPSPELAGPDGLVAIGGDLSPERLIKAYRNGIFPWFSPGDPILWWTPDPRCVLFPEKLRVSRSLRKTIRRNDFEFRLDHGFSAVIHQCAAARINAEGTWITPEMEQAYCRLQSLGFAHSVETWQDGELVGGLYGVALGGIFFGESMFSRVSDASKAALAFLVSQLKHWEFMLIDCQVTSDHLLSLGAEEISRIDFMKKLMFALELPGAPGCWNKKEVIVDFPR